jgi:UDP-N-acetylglucosamine 4,6-dehydratase
MKYLISGGTGSLGTYLTRKLLNEGNEVVVFSRDEYKQKNMQKTIPAIYMVGDVRDKEAITWACKKVDRVIHAAALKHVPVGEEQPDETVKTNILGTMNMIDACVANEVKQAVLVATDKACHPINTYGATKMIGEKLFIWANTKKKTTFNCVRYGNVVGSRGSVIEYLLEKKPKIINATDEKMTRFWISLAQAADLIMTAFEKGRPGDIIVPKAPSSSIVDMFGWISPGTKIKFTGMRPGEKLHESMINKDESLHTEEYEKHFVIRPELFGTKYNNKPFEYTSENARRITKEEFLDLI